MYPMYFKQTRESMKQFEELFDFMWPTIASMWNMRWQVKGYLETCPEATEAQLSGRFISGSGYERISFKKSIVNISWDNQQKEFAKILLTNSFAIYESWLKEVGDEIGLTSRSIKQLQFPTNNNNGVLNELANINITESAMLRDAFSSTFTRNPKYSLSNIDGLLKCYRFFKECRNSYIHDGGKCNQKTFDSYQEFQTVASISNLGLREIPKHDPVIIGESVNLHIRGVVGITDVIIRLMVTLDAELTKSIKSEQYFLKLCNGSSIRGRTLKSDDSECEKQISSYIRKLGLPNPSKVDDIKNYLISMGVVY